MPFTDLQGMNSMKKERLLTNPEIKTYIETEVVEQVTAWISEWKNQIQAPARFGTPNWARFAAIDPTKEPEERPALDSLSIMRSSL